MFNKERVFRKNLIFFFAIIIILLITNNLGPIPLLCRQLFILFVSCLLIFQLCIAGKKTFSIIPTLIFVSAVFFTMNSYLSYTKSGWNTGQNIADAICRIYRLFTDSPVSFGSTAIGLPVIFVYLSLLISAALIYPYKISSKKVLVSISTLMAVYIIYLLFIFSFPMQKLNKINFYMDRIRAYNPVIFSFLIFVPVSILLSGEEKRKIFSKIKITVLLFISSAMLFSLIVIYSTNNKFIDNPGKKSSVLFLTMKGLYNFKTPEYGKYTSEDNGMFGGIKKLLELNDYHTSTTSAISPAILSECSTLVVVNMNQNLTTDEQNAVWEFVKSGGSLLVLGDHTNIAGIQQPMNYLLSPTGIKLNFDCGYPGNNSWLGCYSMFPHPVFKNVKYDRQIGISIGGTLTIGKNSKPLLIGKYGFSDKGNPDNKDRAYLGDYYYKKGEHYGDIILAAESKYGNGRVIAFADTSSFQNGSLMNTSVFVHNIFAYLCNKNPEIKIDKEKLVITDTSHCEKIAAGTFSDSGIMQLCYSVERAGKFMFIGDTFDDIEKCGTYIIIAPTIDFSEQEIKRLNDFISVGGNLILAVNYEDSKASANLLENFGIVSENVPLGGLESEALGMKFRYANSYSAKMTSPEAKVLASALDMPVIYLNKIGKGQLLYICDSRFFHDEYYDPKKVFTNDSCIFLDILLGTFWGIKDIPVNQE